MASPAPNMPALHTIAPDFTLPRDGGGSVNLSDYKGQYVCLYFYPKDMTPGCTTQSIGFSEQRKAFEREGATVIGVSRDSVERHDKFKAKHDLNVILGADIEGDVTESYGVWVEKSMYGKTFMGIQRATFLIGPDGKIAHIWPKVRVKGHIEAVLETLRDLKAS